MHTPFRHFINTQEARHLKKKNNLIGPLLSRNVCFNIKAKLLTQVLQHSLLYTPLLVCPLERRFGRFSARVSEPIFKALFFDRPALWISDSLEKAGEGTCRHSFLFWSIGAVNLAHLANTIDSNAVYFHPVILENRKPVVWPTATARFTGIECVLRSGFIVAN